jgi:hypothetical protein
MQQVLKSLQRSAPLLLCLLLTLGWMPRAEAGIALVFPATFTSADRECFQKDFDAALSTMRNTDPVFAEMLDALNASDIVHFVEYTSDWTTSDGDDEDHHQDIKWNPPAGRRFKSGHVCVDPVAALLHELYHAWENQSGMLKNNRETVLAENNYIPLSELNATKFENLYRRLHRPRLCPRVFYGALALPAAATVLPCAKALSESCSDIAGGCPRCCCWIWGLVKKNGAWYACVKDHVTVRDCDNGLSRGFSASSHPSPCSFPGVPQCP